MVFTSPDQKITVERVEPPHLSNKTGKPRRVVATGGGCCWWCCWPGSSPDPGPVKMCPIFPRAAGGGGTGSVMLSLVIMIITPPPPTTCILDKTILAIS